VKNGSETDIDCGGSCPPCANGQACDKNADCTSLTCKGAKCIDPVLWQQNFDSAVAIIAAAADSSGNIWFLANVTQGGVNFGDGPLNGAGYPTTAMVELRPSGSHLSSQIFTGQMSAKSLAITPFGNIGIMGVAAGNVDLGGGMLTGTGASNAFVAKYGSTGKHIWSKEFSQSPMSSSTYAMGIVATPSDGFVLTRQADPADNYGCGALGQRGVLVVAFDNMGNCLWYKGSAAKLAFNQFGGSVAVDSAGDVYVTGIANGVIDFGGTTSLAMGLDTFVTKLDPTGKHLWTKVFGDGSSAHTRSYVAVDTTGNVFLAGDFTGTIDFGKKPLTAQSAPDGGAPQTTGIFVAKLDPATGSEIWSKSLAGQSVAAVAVDGAGNSVVDTVDSFQFFDSAGNQVWKLSASGQVTFAGMDQLLIFGGSLISKLATPL